MFGKSLSRGKTPTSKKNSKALRRGFAFVLTVAMLCSNIAFAPVTAEAAEETRTQHYIFRAAKTVAENEAQLGSNITFGANVTAAQKEDARFVQTDGWVAAEDGTRNVVTYNLSGAARTGGNGVKSDSADHYGVAYRLISKGDVETEVDPGEDNDGDVENDSTATAKKVPAEMLKVYLKSMEDLDTTGLGAVNLSLLCGFFAPKHDHSSQSNENNVGVEKQLRVFVSVDGEDNWLPVSVGVRSSTLVGGGYLSKGDGLPGTFYRVETENLLTIPGVAGKTIQNIMVMPFGEDQYASGPFRLSELAVNTYGSKGAFADQVPSDVTCIPVDGDTLRQIAVKEAERTALTKWTTDQKMRTYFGSAKKECDYWPMVPWDITTPIIHQGPTYEQHLDSTRELFQSQITMNEETGIGVWNGGRDMFNEGADAVYGMDCQTFVFNAISRVSRSYAWSCAHTVNAPYTSIVGPHLNEKVLPRYTEQDILNPSAPQAVYEAYSLADAGDIADTYGFSTAHIRLVKGVHTVYVPAEGGYFNEVTAPEYAPVAEGKGEYTLSGDFEPVAGGSYIKKDNYVYVGEGNGSYNDHKYAWAGLYKGSYTGTSEGTWVGAGKGYYNKVYGYVEVGAGKGSYNKEDKFVWVGEGQGDYDMVNGVYTRMPLVDGFRRGDYDRVKEGEYVWVGEGQGSFNIDPDQSSMTFVHQASIPKYYFGLPEKDENGDTVKDENGNTVYSAIRSKYVRYLGSSYPADLEYYEGTDDGTEIADPPLIEEGYELLFSCSSRANDEYSFAKVKNGGYAVFTVAEYESGQVEKQNVQAVLGSATLGQHFTDGGAVLGISSNYRLISYEIDLLDDKGNLVTGEDGEALYSTGLQYIMEANIMTQTLTSSVLNKALVSLPNGKYTLRLFVDSGPLTALDKVDVPRTEIPLEFEIVGRTQAQLTNGDVFYIPSACSAGQPVLAYVIKSASGAHAVGDAVMVNVESKYADGTDANSRARFWRVEDGAVKRCALFTTGIKYQYGYHDVITGIEGNTLKITDATGHSGSGQNCSYKHDPGCDGSDAYECAGTLTIPSDLSILDLRTDALNGKVQPVNELAEVQKLTDAGLAVINTYVPDGSSSKGTASVVVVIDPTRSYTATYNVSKVDPDIGGTIQLNRTSGAAGDLVTVTATPAESCVLETIFVDGTPIVGNTFPIRGLHTVTAQFTQYANLVTVTKVPGGTVEVDKRGGEDGETVTITATPYEDYVLKAIQVNGEDINGNTFTLNGNATVEAVFAKLVRPGDVMYFPGDPVGLEYVEGYLVSSDTPDSKIFFFFEGGFSGD